MRRAYVPSLLGGSESVDNVELPAAAALTIAGDIASALAAEPSRPPIAITPWVDDRGRSRRRVSFDR